jgi:signal peptidase II
MRESARRAAVLGALTLLVGCDHVTKYAAKAELEGGDPRAVIPGMLDLRYAENTDVAFNLLRWVPEASRKPLLLVAGGVAVAALVALLLRRKGAAAARVALLLVTAGALGNYLDRIARGYVVDFVHVPHWPVFNVADAYVVVGAALFGVLAIRERQQRA